LAYGNKDSATYKIQLKCGKAWIRIRIEVGIRIHSETQADPKHWEYTSYLSQLEFQPWKWMK
jgi:hypothetical protein